MLTIHLRPTTSPSVPSERKVLCCCGLAVLSGLSRGHGSTNEEDKDAMLCHVCTRAVREGKLQSGNAEPACDLVANEFVCGNKSRQRLL